MLYFLLVGCMNHVYHLDKIHAAVQWKLYLLSCFKITTILLMMLVDFALGFCITHYPKQGTQGASRKDEPLMSWKFRLGIFAFNKNPWKTKKTHLHPWKKLTFSPIAPKNDGGFEVRHLRDSRGDYFQGLCLLVSGRGFTQKNKKLKEIISSGRFIINP